MSESAKVYFTCPHCGEYIAVKMVDVDGTPRKPTLRHNDPIPCQADTHFHTRDPMPQEKL